MRAQVSQCFGQLHGGCPKETQYPDLIRLHESGIVQTRAIGRITAAHTTPLSMDGGHVRSLRVRPMHKAIARVGTASRCGCSLVGQLPLLHRYLDANKKPRKSSRLQAPPKVEYSVHCPETSYDALHQGAPMHTTDPLESVVVDISNPCGSSRFTGKEHHETVAMLRSEPWPHWTAQRRHS